MTKYYLEFLGKRYTLAASSDMTEPFTIEKLSRRDYVYLHGKALEAIVKHSYIRPDYSFRVVKEVTTRSKNTTTLTTEDLCQFQFVHRIEDV